MPKKYTTLSIAQSTRDRFETVKWEIKRKCNDDALLFLLEIKNVKFKLEKGNSKKEVSGFLLYESLLNGWKIGGYNFKQ